MSGKLIPAIIAGVVTFIISFILGLIPIVGLCACFMPLVGGVFAVFLYSNKASIVNAGTGASVGLMAGGFHTLLSLIVTPISLFIQWNRLQAQLEPSLRELKRSGINLEGGTLIIAIAVVLILGIVLLLGLYALGGLIGGAIFKKEGQQSTPYTPPMPPTSFGA
jgi:hypothetical protein